MKAVLVLFDSLNRAALSPYVKHRGATPNFERLAQKTTVFDNHYVGSMPCMPARRDMLTGRLSFLHRSWGPMEPFDESFPDRLAEEKGTYSHLITDHFHYWEDGGATYHTRYDSFSFVRGQEGDRWQAKVAPDWQALNADVHPNQQGSARRNYKAQHLLNRKALDEADSHPTQVCMDQALAFLGDNRAAENWFLQVECFDPHEPFHVPKKYRTGRVDASPSYDWPIYGPDGDQTADEAAQLVESYEASVRHCDDQLGRLLDLFDAEDLWADTALIVTTDHGFLLGEHGYWGKNRMPLYEEIAHIPLFFHDPAKPAMGERCAALTQSIDVAATAYDLFDGTPSEACQGYSLRAAIAGHSPREAVIFGYFGGAVNLADGRYLYQRCPEDFEAQTLYQYTLMPTHIHSFFSAEEMQWAELHEGFSFTKGMKMLRIPATTSSPMNAAYGPGNMLPQETQIIDLTSDTSTSGAAIDPLEEDWLSRKMAELMRDVEAPPDAFARIGLAA